MKQIKVMIEGTGSPKELSEYLELIGKYIPPVLADGTWNIDNVGGHQGWNVVMVTKSIDNDM